MNLVELPSRFYSFRELPLRYIVLHTTQGTDSRTWLTETGGVSAHYLVREDIVYRLVGEDWASWHAGIIVGKPTTPLYRADENPNDVSIGIEVEGYAAQPLSDAAVRSTAELIVDIRRRHGPLPLVSHSELSPGNRSDPGVENRQRIEQLLKEPMDKILFEAWFLENQLKHITPTILAMKASYDPLAAASHTHGTTLEQRIAALEEFVVRLREL